MEKYVMFLKDGKITIQEAEYIEDGWYIEIFEGVISLFEIPLFGGVPAIKIGDYQTIIDAINAKNKLT